jgi:hypothetical protein
MNSLAQHEYRSDTHLADRVSELTELLQQARDEMQNAERIDKEFEDENDCHCPACKALSQPTDTTALQAAIDAAYERAAVVCEGWDSDAADPRDVAWAIRTLKGTS